MDFQNKSFINSYFSKFTMSKKESNIKDLKEIMTHQNAFVSTKGSNEKDLKHAADLANKRYGKGSS